MSSPTFADVDGDGDLDAFIGEYDGTINYFQNDGGTFTEITGAANPLNGFDVGLLSSPTFADVDGDGDLDAFIGERDGNINYFENDGGTFTEITGAANPFNGFDVGSYSTPTFADVDGDGDLDAFIGERDGNINYFENDGGTFTEITGAANPLNGFDVGSFSSPTFADVDKDGDLDAFIGEYDGTIFYFQNDGGTFTEITGAANPFNGFDVGYFSSPTFADVDGDGDLDAFIGEFDGNINYFQNNTAPELDTAQTPVLTAIDEDETAPTGDAVASIVVDGSITDVDYSADSEAIAVTATDNTNGSWEYSTDGGANWLAFPANIAENLAVLLDETANIRFVPAAEYSGTATFTFRAWDKTFGASGDTAVDTTTNGSSTAFSVSTDTAEITVNSINDAPVLDNTLDASGATADIELTVDEDATPTGAVGSLVSEIVALNQNVTDVDTAPAPVTGIAVTALDETNGTWHYTTDGGTNWTAVGAVSDASALLLAADANTRLLFAPTADYNGSIANAITFRAWDQTSGTASTTADTTINGDATAFSTATDTANVTVTPVNDDPIITSANTANVAENTTGVTTVTATDVDGDTPTYSITGGADSALFGIDATSGAVTFTAAPDFETPTDVGTDNVYELEVTADDSNGGTTAQTISVTVTNENEVPTITSANTASVAENTTAVITVTATDVDGDTPTYSITGGADSALFGIDAASGAVTFTAAPDFETPTDVGTDNIYELEVTADDGNGGLTPQTISVTVTNENEVPTITSGNTASVAESTTAVITVTATDVDGDTPTYSITGGADSALFGIDATSGAVTFTAAPDFETPTDVGTDNVYELEVTADDSNGGLTPQTISVTVTNENEVPTITSGNTASVAENTTAVITVTATDVDGDTPTYSITGGADSALFGIDATSGAVTFTAAPDFETPTDVGTDNVYELEVTADDSNGGLTPQTISVTVTNENEVPTITSGNTASVAENTTAVITVTATDVDGDTPTYSITGGADSALFGIDATSGAVTFTAAPDFETPTDVGTDNIYELEVTADDGNGGLTPQTISVTVTNENEVPTITSGNTASVAENTTAVITVTATDVDGDTPTYSITGGADSALFGIDATSGAVTFTAAPDFETPTDVGTDNVYELEVTADDGNGGLTPQTISVTVTNENEVPTITSGNTASVAESTTAVITVTATDVDGDTPTYSITGGADATLFGIDAASGAVTFTAAPDFETPTDVGTDNIYELEVTADDGNGGTTAQTISVTVTNENEVPTITSGSTASVAENATAVTTVVATDAEGDTPTYSITGGADATLFGIDAASGAVTFTAAPDFETPTDVGTDNIYELEVTADDSNGGTTAQTISVTVTNENEVPTITSGNTASVAENTTAVITVTATDVDGDTPTYSITGGADATLFGIDAASGAVTFTAAPDFETPTDVGTDNIYELEVTADDSNGGTTAQTISVTVTNENEVPTITSGNTASVAENATAVTTVTATDVDGDTPTYSITGGADATLFGIDATSGAVTFTAAPDFETPGDAGTDNIYELEVTADDSNGGTDIQTISVTVTDANDAPTITSANTASVAENATAVTTVVATDVDGDTPTFAITGGADSALFGIDATSGAVTFTAAPDFETPTDVGTDNVYELEVTADDSNGGTTAQTISVTVTNENEVPTITSANTASVAENTTAVITVTATDVDGDTPTYSITGGADATLFGIDAASGAVTFTAAPDFETPTDVEQDDNIYELEVTADDGNGGLTPQTISVTVTNENEVPTITSGSTASVAENATAVTTVVATDAEGDTPTYSITGGADATLFGIDAATGEVTFTAAPDFETPTDVGTDNIYELEVTADDSNGGLTRPNHQRNRYQRE